MTRTVAMGRDMLCNQVHSAFSADYARDYTALVRFLLKHGLRMLVYAGDADYTFNWMGCKDWTRELM